MNMLERIQELCQRRNISIAELERRANFGNGTIRRWGSAYPSVDKVAKVAALLNTSIEYLYRGTEQNVPNVAARKMGSLSTEEMQAISDMIDFYLSKKK